jgi:hypothetical protein
MGRLIGTLLSGVIYQFTRDNFGLSVCLWTSTVFMIAAAASGSYLEPKESTLLAGTELVTKESELEAARATVTV